VLIADILNTHLERAGQAARLHPDSLEHRQLDRKPEPKLLPSESRAYREHGVISARMQEVFDIRAERTQQMAGEQNNARAYWEGRKAELEITRDMPLVEQLTYITQAREHISRHVPTRPTLAQLREQERTLEQEVTGLERHVQALQRSARRERRIEQGRTPRTWPEELADERVLAAGKAHGLPRDRHAEQMVARLEWTARTSDVAQRLRGLAQALEQDEPQHGAALRITLFDREEEREREQDRGRADREARRHESGLPGFPIVITKFWSLRNPEGHCPKPTLLSGLRYLRPERVDETLWSATAIGEGFPWE